MDLIIGRDTVTEKCRPVWTVWRPGTVAKDKTAHKRRARRTFKQYMKTGNVRLFNSSQKLLTSWDFD